MKQIHGSKLGHYPFEVHEVDSGVRIETNGDAWPQQLITQTLATTAHGGVNKNQYDYSEELLNIQAGRMLGGNLQDDSLRVGEKTPQSKKMKALYEGRVRNSSARQYGNNSFTSSAFYSGSPRIQLSN